MDWQALAQAVIERRVELGFRTREAFAAETGLSSRLLGDLERATRDNFDRVTLARLEQALEWAPGTARHILTKDETPVDSEGSDLDASSPLDAKLILVRTRAGVMPPADRARLLASLDVLLEWQQSRIDAAMTPEQRAERDRMLAQMPFERPGKAAEVRERRDAGR